MGKENTMTKSEKASRETPYPITLSDLEDYPVSRTPSVSETPEERQADTWRQQGEHETAPSYCSGLVEIPVPQVPGLFVRVQSGRLARVSFVQRENH